MGNEATSGYVTIFSSSIFIASQSGDLITEVSTCKGGGAGAKFVTCADSDAKHWGEEAWYLPPYSF